MALMVEKSLFTPLERVTKLLTIVFLEIFVRVATFTKNNKVDVSFNVLVIPQG